MSQGLPSVSFMWEGTLFPSSSEYTFFGVSELAYFSESSLSNLAAAGWLLSSEHAEFSASEKSLISDVIFQFSQITTFDSTLNSDTSTLREIQFVRANYIGSSDDRGAIQSINDDGASPYLIFLDKNIFSDDAVAKHI